MPDVSGDIYEKDGHYWQDVTERYLVTYGSSIPAEYSPIQAVSNMKYPQPDYLLNEDFCDKWGLTGGSKTVNESITKTVDLGPVWGTNTAPNIKKGKPQFWYGCVNYWTAKSGNQYWFEKQIPVLIQQCKCSGYHIEMVEWAGNGMSSAQLDSIKAAYKKLCKICRDNKMWVFVDVINGNFNGGKTSWTAGFPGYSKQTVESIVNGYGQKLIDIIKEEGPQNIIVQPIGEPGSKGYVSACQKFQDMCCNQLTGWILVTELNGRSNSSLMKSNCKFNVKHVSNNVSPVLKENDQLIKGKNDKAGDWESIGSDIDIVVSDTGQAIQALASPEPGQQGHLKKWTSAISRASRLVSYFNNYRGKCAVVVYYAFKFGYAIDGELAKGTWSGIHPDLEYP